SDHTSEPAPARRLRPSRSPKSPEPECASEPPSGFLAAIRLQLGVGAEIGVGVAIGVPAGGRRLALLVARKTAVATASAEITALDAEWEIPRRGGERAHRRGRAAHHQRPKCPSHRVLRGRLGRVSPFVSRQASLLSVNSRSRVGYAGAELRVVAARSVRGIDRPYARAAIAARLAAGVVIGVLDAVEKPPRSGGLTLLVARKGAVAETRIFIALNAKRIAGANGLGRRGADHRQSAGGQQSQNYVTHESLPSAAAVRSSIPSGQPKPE